MAVEIVGRLILFKLAILGLLFMVTLYVLGEVTPRDFGRASKNMEKLRS
jgi:hypothetical protein